MARALGLRPIVREPSWARLEAADAKDPAVQANSMAGDRRSAAECEARERELMRREEFRSRKVAQAAREAREREERAGRERERLRRLGLGGHVTRRGVGEAAASAALGTGPPLASQEFEVSPGCYEN